MCPFPMAVSPHCRTSRFELKRANVSQSSARADLARAHWLVFSCVLPILTSDASYSKNNLSHVTHWRRCVAPSVLSRSTRFFFRGVCERICSTETPAQRLKTCCEQYRQPNLPPFLANSHKAWRLPSAREQSAFREESVKGSRYPVH